VSLIVYDPKEQLKDCEDATVHASSCISNTCTQPSPLVHTYNIKKAALYIIAQKIAYLTEWESRLHQKPISASRSKWSILHYFVNNFCMHVVNVKSPFMESHYFTAVLIEPASLQSNSSNLGSCAFTKRLIIS